MTTSTEPYVLNIGPQHPSTHGVLRVVLRTDGEMVLEAVPHIGYLHRCAEKIGENIAYFQYIHESQHQLQNMHSESYHGI